MRRILSHRRETSITGVIAHREGHRIDRRKHKEGRGIEEILNGSVKRTPFTHY